MKSYITTAIGFIGGAISSAFGGFDAGLITLIIFMIIDYITGFIVAAVFHKSTKTQTGSLESMVGWKGLCRKGMTLLVVLIACRLDKMIGTDFVRDVAVIGYTANEAISIIENAGLMGLPVPNVIMRAIEVLKQKSEDKDLDFKKEDKQ